MTSFDLTPDRLFKNSVRGLILLSFLFVTGCGHSGKKKNPISSGQVVSVPLKNLPQLQPGSQIKLGGFSGLWFEKEENGQLLFWTLTDRGPNAQSYNRDDGQLARPFVLPNFQPEMVQFAINPITKEVQILQRRGLFFQRAGRDSVGQRYPASGLPNRAVRVTREKRFGFPLRERIQVDEIAVDTRGRELQPDLLGLDPEGICRDLEGNFWIVEEYLPSILKVQPDGKVVKRIVPEKALTKAELRQLRTKLGAEIFEAKLPDFLNERKMNLGFEGVACVNGSVFASLQSPFDDSRLIPLIELNTKTFEVSSVHRYPLNQEQNTMGDGDKIGDLVSFNLNLLVLQQDSKVGPSAQKNLFAVNPFSRVRPLEKLFLADLSQLGFSKFEKLEGLAVIPESPVLAALLPEAEKNDFVWIAVINDNDFGLTGAIDAVSGEALLKGDSKIVLGLIPLPKKIFSQ